MTDISLRHIPRRGLQAEERSQNSLRLGLEALAERVETLERRLNQARAPIDVRPTVLTVAAFCTRNDLSKTTFYSLLRAGQGPKVMKIGSSTRITYKSEATWRRQMENATSLQS